MQITQALGGKMQGRLKQCEIVVIFFATMPKWNIDDRMYAHCKANLAVV